MSALAGLPDVVWMALAGAAALIALFWKAFSMGRKSGRDEARAKEADSYEQHLRDIEDAANARTDADRRNADPGRLRDDDGHRRD